MGNVPKEIKQIPPEQQKGQNWERKYISRLRLRGNSHDRCRSKDPEYKTYQDSKTPKARQSQLEIYTRFFL